MVTFTRIALLLFVLLIGSTGCTLLKTALSSLRSMDHFIALDAEQKIFYALRGGFAIGLNQLISFQSGSEPADGVVDSSEGTEKAAENPSKHEG